MTPDELARRAVALRQRSDAPRVLVGIAGAPGSGKSTLAAAVIRVLAGRDDWRGTEIAHVPMDGFHLADAELDRLGRRDRKGAPETFDAAGYAALLGRIRAGEAAWAPDFERDLEQPIAQALPVEARVHTVLSEGNYLLLPDGDWPLAREHFDEVWFCRMAAHLRRDRLIARHVRYGKTAAEAHAWVDRVDEENAALVERTAGAADLIVPVP